MSGFCGWVGAPPPGDPEAALEAMAEKLTCATRAGPGMAAPQAALASRAALGSGGFGSDAGIVASFEGYPRWEDRNLEQLAATRGVPHALIEGYRSFGAGLPSRIKGPVSFAVLDPESRSGVVSIDRVGVHGVCLAKAPGGGLVFGTTADAVAAFPGLSSTLSNQALYEFLFLIDKIPAPDTIYLEQSKLIPGQCIVVVGGAFEVRRYWTPGFNPDRRSTKAQLCERLRDRLDTAVRRCLAGEDDEKTGSFLSGGLDSSTVSGLLAKNVSGRAKAFTISFTDPRYDESPFARMAARRYGLEHVLHNVEPQEVLDTFLEIATLYDEPFANSSAVPSLACARRAREKGVDLLLAGDGGDELFAGNSRYLKDVIFQRYRCIPRPVRDLLIEPLALRPGAEKARGLPGKVARYTRLARLSIPARALSDNIYSAYPAARVFDPDIAQTLDPDRPVRLAEEIFAEPTDGTDLQRYLYLDLRFTLADSDLRKIGRMCDLAGVRVRFPMLDDDMLDFAFQVPPEILCERGELRSFYKEAFAEFLPAEILTKPKHGFGLPFQEFLGEYPPLRDFTADTLTSLKTRRVFSRDFLDHYISEVRKGPQGDFGWAWDLMVIEHWLQSRRL